MDEELRHWIAELRQFSVCQLADALGRSCAIETGIRPIDRRFRVCGPALTVECAPGDNLTLHHALHIAQSGDVLVVSGSADCDGALWGELMSMSAHSRGLAGTIIDGPVRDPVEIRDLEYPVFCRDFNPRRAAKEAYGRINGPVKIGTVSINPGDIVRADANGIVCIPSASLPEVVQLASEVLEKENSIKDQILSGRTIFEIFQLQQYVASGHAAEKK